MQHDGTCFFPRLQENVTLPRGEGQAALRAGSSMRGQSKARVLGAQPMPGPGGSQSTEGSIPGHQGPWRCTQVSDHGWLDRGSLSHMQKLRKF